MDKKEKMKWLGILLCFHVASFVVWLMGYLPLLHRLCEWGQILMTIGMVLCLFKISPIDRCYQLAAVLKAILLIRPVFYALLPDTALVSMVQWEYYGVVASVVGCAVLILSWAATYLEYRAHGGLTAERNLKLAQNWKMLFIGSLCFAVLGTAASWAAARLYGLLEMGIALVNVVHYGVQIGSRVFSVIYIYLLYKTIQLIKE